MKKIIGLAIILSLALTGCLNTYDLTEDQAEIISEYASSVVLKHDRAYAEELNDAGKPEVELTDDETTSEPENSDTKENGTNKTPSSGDSSTEKEPSKEPTKTSLTKVIGKDGFTIKYHSYALYDSYPENTTDSGYMISASKNGKLLIANVTVKNTTKAEKKFNTMSDKWNVTLDSPSNDEVSVSYFPDITFLTNSLQYADVKIAAGKSKKMVLVFKVPAKENYDNYTLTVKNGDFMSVNTLK